MTLRTPFLAATLLMLAACGGDFLGNDAGVVYTFTTGTYGVTNAVLAPSTTDECGLLAAYQDPAKKIGIDVTGTTVTFNLANDSQAAANTLPLAVLDGNTIDTATEANYTVAYGTGCVVRVHRYVTGHVVANNTAALALDFKVAVESGSCPANITSFTAVPCHSQYQFTGTRQ